MNKKILLSGILIAGSLLSNAQNKKVTYAITGDGNKDFVWMNIREVDLSTGLVTKTLFDRSKSSFTLTDVNTKKLTTDKDVVAENILTAANVPTSTFVAAAAYDNRTNKLFYAPMRRGELRWLDLSSSDKTPAFYTSQINNYKLLDANDEATNITRMVIGADGMGYALSNDGNHFFSFTTTGKVPVITDLGGLVDADENSGISIHNKCSCWGGDMIADAFGKLYVISASHNVFVIDPVTRIATYKGSISGLPANYTTNAAAVNEEGIIVVASANLFEGYYKLSIKDLKATKMEGSDTKYNASDFANGNLLFQKEANELLGGKITAPVKISSSTKVFPNPVTNSSFNVILDNQSAGKYVITVSDLTGRVFSTKTTQIIEGIQTEKVKLNSGMSKGIYIVKAIDEKGTIIINEKIFVQ